jgi:hypothetical protein
MTAVPKISFAPQGPILPAELDILSGVQQDMDAAFGVTFDKSLTTPQGQLASSETASIGAKNDEFLFLVQQFDPAYAEGRYQDALGRLYFLEREPSQPTIVVCTCVGLAGTIIPQGALAQDQSGNTYVATSSATIPVGGSVSATFANQQVGPIPCPANTLTGIYQAIPGWDTINNPADGVLGVNTETRAAFEARRRLSVSQNAVGSIPAIEGELLGTFLNGSAKVPGIIDAYVIDNYQNSPQTIGGVTIPANTLYAAVVGGADAAIAAAIWRKKAPGCGYTGNTTVVVQDMQSGYSPPYPSYSVSFTRAANLQIIFQVNLINSTLVPLDAATQIQGAIVSAIVGGDGGSRARIGVNTLASRFYAPIAALGAWGLVKSIKIGSFNVPTSAFYGAISGTTLTVTGVSSGALAAGQYVVDAAGTVSAGTTIVSQLTGTTGGVGTYQISLPQTVAAANLAGVVPGLDEVTVNINQYPVASAANIAVSLVS